MQKPGTKYNHDEEKIEIVEDLIEEDIEKEVDEITIVGIFGGPPNRPMMTLPPCPPQA